MTDCSSIQGSTSSSSDVMTLTTAASSWCAIPTNSRIRVLRLIRPHHTRRMLMVTGPESNPSYGFAVRGGKEFGTGFFVSQVERNSEADLKGLRIGDQILRLNNFRVEDAVHKEFIRFVNSQDRITLKVRGVGMLPIKDKENERLSWNVVKMHSISNTPSESSYKTVTTEQSSTCSAVGVLDLRSKDISVILDVAPRTKLGLGICKGPEWKPGIFVQFTKDKSVAREAGLRPGDQILSVNSIDFSDVLFSEAVAVMKSSNKLEMIVRTAAGCDLFPGESSGYNSSASSVTGDQSPCWADVKQKRLTAVSEEPMIAACWNETFYSEQRRNGLERRPKEVNKTIIQLSENGTSINNTYVANTHVSGCLAGEGTQINGNGQQDNTLKKTSLLTTPSSAPPTNELYSNTEQPGRVENMKIDDSARGNANNAVFVDIYRNMIKEEEKRNQVMGTLQRNSTKTTSMTSSSQAKSIGPPKAPPPVLYSNLGNYSNNNDFSNANDVRSTIRQHNFGDVASAASSSTLSSAITEELKKRKEKQRYINNAENHNFVGKSNSNYGKATSISQGEQQQQQQHQQNKMTPSTVTMQRQHQRQQQQQHQQQHQNNQLQASKLTTSVSSSSTTSPAKRAPSVRAVNSSVANCNDRGNTLDQHSALMDEFKAAHQRMFKNGFHERESKERQEALKRTTMMEDDTSHRTSRHFTNGKLTANDHVDGHQQNQPNNQNQQHIPPPPPEFANSPPKSNHKNDIYNYQTIKRANGVTTSNSASTKATKPPSSPTPDYDNQQQSREDKHVQINCVKSVQNGLTKTTTTLPPSQTRRTIRLGAVTIGEYEQQRKEPNKFEFIGAQNHVTNGNNGNNFQSELQKTLSRSKLKKDTQHIEHKQDCPLRNGYSVENLTRKIQGVGLNQKQSTLSCENIATVKRNSCSSSNAGTGNGILKNGPNRSNAGNTNSINGHATKIIEKTITFGN